MKLMIISPKNRTVYNFRGDLIKSIIALGHEVIVTGPNNIDIEKIKALGASFFTIPLNKNGLNVIKDFKYQATLKKLIKAEKPDIVFSYTAKPVIYGTHAAKKCGVKKIVPMITGAGYAFTAQTNKAKFIRKILCFLYKHALKGASSVIFQNPDDMNLFLNHNVRALM